MVLLECAAGIGGQLPGSNLCPKFVEYFGRGWCDAREHLERALVADVVKLGRERRQRAPRLEPGRLVDAYLQGVGGGPWPGGNTQQRVNRRGDESFP